MAAKAKETRVFISSTQRAVRIPRKQLTELICFVASAEGTRLDEVDLAVVDEDEIARLNRHYLGREGRTDVLSFDLSQPGRKGLACQLVVCGPVAAQQAKEHQGRVGRELMLYVVHGLLHLLGYNDTTASKAARMQAREEELLEQFRESRRR